MTEQHDEKPKNSERQVEWSFDFASLGDSLRNVVDSLAGEEEVQEGHFEAPMEDAESARIKVDFSLGEGFISAAEDGAEALFAADLKYIGEIEFDVQGDTVKEVKLRQKKRVSNVATPLRQGLRALADREDLSWDVKVARGIPMSFDVDGGVGPVKLDLTGISVRNLSVDAGVGTLSLTLPEQNEKITGEIDGGVGQTRIYIPDNADTTLEIDGGVGAIDVTIPPNAAVQLKASSGIGSVNVPQSLKRLSRKDFMEQGGVWQSEGFDLAERRIVLRYEGGVGSFTLREAELV